MIEIGNKVRLTTIGPEEHGIVIGFKEGSGYMVEVRWDDGDVTMEYEIDLEVFPV